MNRLDLINKLEQLLGSRAQARDAALLIFGEMKRALRASENIVITGFGSFRPYLTRPKRGRNPSTGETLHIKPRRKVRFRAAQGLLDISVGNKPKDP